MSQKGESNPFPANDRTSTPTGTAAEVVNGEASLTVQERVDLAGGTEYLSMSSFRLDPERPFGHPLTICLQLRYRGVSSETSAHRLTPDERGFFTNSIIHTLGRLISKKSAPLSRERKQFTHYTDLLLQLKEDRASLLYSQQGARIPITVYCRSMEELDEIWARYQSGKLQDELQVYFEQLHLPFGPVSVDVKIYNYEECKRKFRFAGFRLLYLQYPQLTTKRR